MGKHAYAIIAHNDVYTLNILLELLDDPRNDIYILLDKTVSPSFEENIKTLNLHTYIVPYHKRIDIRWGGISQVEAELGLFEFIQSQKIKYDFIQLLSGCDLPIKSQNFIHSFFDSRRKNTNLIGFSSGDAAEKDIRFKTDYYHLFTNHFKPKNNKLKTGITLNLAKLLRFVSVKLQKSINLRRNWGEMTIKKGANWVSITPEFTAYLLTNKDFILKKFRYIPCVDEIYKQTMAWNSKFKDTILDPDKDFACGTRLIDWERGNPYVWRQKDFEEIINSDSLFARKFSSVTDTSVINKIYENLKNYN